MSKYYTDAFSVIKQTWIRTATCCLCGETATALFPPGSEPLPFDLPEDWRWLAGGPEFLPVCPGSHDST